MIEGVALLLGCELAGEALRALTHVTVPGPVLGMLLLTVLLLLRSRRDDGARTRDGRDTGLDRVAGGLISNMGLLFVPAGVGVIAQFHLIKAQWLPIAVALLGSTLLGLIVTGVVMRWTSRPAKNATCELHGVADR